MEGIELAAFEIIVNAGEAKSLFLEAMRFAREKKFTDSNNKIIEGELYQKKAHDAHVKLLSDFSDNNLEINKNILLIHAEDQLMTAEIMKLIALEITEIYKKITEIEGN